MAITEYGDISRNAAYFSAECMLKAADPLLVLSKFGAAKAVPKNKSKTIDFRRPKPFAALTTALAEGVTPAGGKMTYDQISVTLAQFGDYVALTDVVHDTAENEVLRDASVECGKQAALTIEKMTWGVLRAGTNVFYANGTTRAGVNTTITLNKQRAITRALKAQKAMKITQMVSSSPNFATEAVAPAYIALAHTNLESDIRNLAGFTPTEKYGQMKALDGEIGKVEDVRYILTSSLDGFGSVGSTTLNGMLTTASAVDVYPIIFLGEDAYGVVSLKGGGAIKPMVLNPNTPRGGDPLGQRGSVAWKTMTAAVILNDAWMCRLECGASSL